MPAQPLRNESLFLAYRRFFPIVKRPVRMVGTEEEIVETIRSAIEGFSGRLGILQSGGMDSAVLANFMPKGSVAYTFAYEGERDEFKAAKAHVKPGIEHRRVNVSRDDFLAAIDELTQLKQMPLVPHEAPIWVACKAAKADGVKGMVTGAGADGRFGGFPHLYRNPAYDDFRKVLMNGATRIRPHLVFNEAQPVDWVVGHYTFAGKVAVQSFLNEVGTEGSAVHDLIAQAGMEPVLPFARMRWSEPFDIDKITGDGEKYLIQGIFAKLYPDAKPAKKLPLAVPGRLFLSGYKPTRPEFRADIDLDMLSKGGAKRLVSVYMMERYLHFKEKLGWSTPEPPTIFS